MFAQKETHSFLHTHAFEPHPHEPLLYSIFSNAYKFLLLSSIIFSRKDKNFSSHTSCIIITYVLIKQKSDRISPTTFLILVGLKVRGGSRNSWTCCPLCRRARSASAWLSCWRARHPWICTNDCCRCRRYCFDSPGYTGPPLNGSGWVYRPRDRRHCDWWPPTLQ